MIEQSDIDSTASQWTDASARSRRLLAFYTALSCLMVGAVSIPAVLISWTIASGGWRYVVLPLVTMAIQAPIALYMGRTAVVQQERSNALAQTLEAQLSEAVRSAERETAGRVAQVRRQEFETRFANALEMAEDETEVLQAVERALGATLPDAPSELLLADNSHAHLVRMAVASPDGTPPTCPVDSPDHCPAARRAQVQQFPDSDALDACPKLRNRPGGRCSALCVPVSIMGRTVGVIHATREPETRVDEPTVADLSTLAKLAGARIGLLRVMAETQLQASTDSLTGLLNRRSLENKVRSVRTAHSKMVVAMADLDHFKELNDTHGHDTGDRALRMFSQVLRQTLRGDDLVARYGGEEFAIILPSCNVQDAQAALDHVRSALATAVTTAGLPRFTVSIGLVEADEQQDLAALLSAADEALFEAKREGRDRVVAHDANGQRVTPAPRKRRSGAPSTTRTTASHPDVAEPNGTAKPSESLVTSNDASNGTSDAKSEVADQARDGANDGAVLPVA